MLGNPAKTATNQFVDVELMKWFDRFVGCPRIVAYVAEFDRVQWKVTFNVQCVSQNAMHSVLVFAEVSTIHCYLNIKKK